MCHYETNRTLVGKQWYRISRSKYLRSAYLADEIHFNTIAFCIWCNLSAMLVRSCLYYILLFPFIYIPFPFLIHFHVLYAWAKSTRSALVFLFHLILIYSQSSQPTPPVFQLYFLSRTENTLCFCSVGFKSMHAWIKTILSKSSCPFVEFHNIYTVFQNCDVENI